MVLQHDRKVESPAGNRGRSNICNSHQSSQHRTFVITPHSNTNETTNNKRRKEQSQTFGDSFTTKEEGIIRIVSQNVNCFGVSTHHNHKQEITKTWLIENSIDVVGWQETGIASHMFPRNKRLHERMKDPRWSKQRLSAYNNKHERVSRLQYGGTAVMAVNEAAHRVKATGGDPTGLGRWSWILFEGKQRHLVRIISAYVPCKTSGKHRQTVYSQHSRYFQRTGNTECPRKLLHTHLTTEINRWQQKGENIVLLIDTNENLQRMGPLQHMLTTKCQLVDPIRAIHQQNCTSLPSTSLTGSYPIDGIFVSRNLQHITRGGWLTLEDSIGDHRSLFIDILINLLLGEPISHIPQHTARRLVCDRPDVVDKFNTLLNSQLQSQGTFRKFQQFETHKLDGSLNPSQEITLLNKIDASITNSVRHAEKRCRKLRFGGVAFEPESNQAGKIINVWNNVIRKKKGCNISSTYIKRIAKKAGISSPTQLSLSDCEAERKMALKTYYQAKMNAKHNRKAFTTKLATLQAAQGNESISNAIRRLNRIEELQESHRRIKYITKPFFGATDKVLVYNLDSNTEETTTDKSTIEHALSNQNKRKFTDAYSSPFLQDPLLSLIGQNATTREATQILDGTFHAPRGLHPTTKQFIDQMQRPPCISNCHYNNTTCTLEEATSYWRKKREKTSSSMSQRHIGTYKALTYNNLPTLNLLTKVANYAFNIGLPLERWTYDLDISLLKKPNKIRPSELRTIGTLEADFNQHASLHFSQRMMGLGLKHGLIPSSQYAKRGNRAIEAAIVKVLYFDYLRINKLNGAFLAMDLENCFDRMAHPVSSLCTQRLGVSPKITSCMINALCSMKHFIRTAYGDSDVYYTGESNRPFQGGIQGNGAASPIFIAISCVILQYIESQILGFSITSAISLTFLSLVAIMYVDDTDIMLAGASHADTPHHVALRAQHAATTYQAAVHQTGGAIRPNRCPWYSISFKWSSGKWRYNKTVTDDTIVIKNTQIVHEPITQLNVSIGWKGLGIVATPDGNWNDHLTYLINEKIVPWSHFINTSYLQRHDVYRAAFTSMFKTITYTLPATFLNTSQCKTIDIHLHKKFLPRIGIDVHLPLAYRYSSPRYQGLGSLNTETT